MKIYCIAFFILFNSMIFADDFVIDEPGSSSSSSPSVKPSTPPNAPAYTPVQKGSTPSPGASGGGNVTAIGSVPTTDTLGRAKFDIGFAMYDNGGMNTKLMVGIFDVLDIGISENVDGLIGSGNANLNIPGACIKITIIKDLNNFNWGLGFDSFAYGRNGSYIPPDTNVNSSTIYGFYTSAGFRYSLFGYNDFFSYGIRVPLLPSEFRELSNTSLFLGATAAVSPYFCFGFTLENFYLNFTRSDRILPSFLVNFMPSPQFRLSIILQYESYSGKLNRILSLGYVASF
jgi:hypothetical protein